jgi:hypothetical protein
MRYTILHQVQNYFKGELRMTKTKKFGTYSSPSALSIGFDERIFKPDSS